MNTPTSTWHPGEDVPHLTPAPETDADDRPLPGEWERYRAAIAALNDCPNATGRPTP